MSHRDGDWMSLRHLVDPRLLLLPFWGFLLNSLHTSMPDCRHCDREFVDDNALQQVILVSMLSTNFFANFTHQSTDENHQCIENHIIALQVHALAVAGRLNTSPASIGTCKPSITAATPAPGVLSPKVPWMMSVQTSKAILSRYKLLTNITEAQSNVFCTCVTDSEVMGRGLKRRWTSDTLTLTCFPGLISQIPEPANVQLWRRNTFGGW